MSSMTFENMPALQSFLDTKDRCTIEVHCDAVKDVYIKLGMLRASMGKGSPECQVLDEALEVIALLYKDLDEIHTELTAC